jgi:NADH-quinone oxidoreductase subunit N
VFIAFLRLFYLAFGDIHSTWKLVIAIITALTLFIGNVTAVFQQSVKRMLAYSSIAQAGFMLMAILALNSIGSEGILLYTTAYCLSTIGLFAILVKMKDYTFEGFNGFAKHQPLLAAVAVIFLLSLAGIPLTAGFLAKYYMLSAVINNGDFLWLVIFAVLMAAISVYYYFRVIQAMYFKDGEAQAMEVSSSFKWTIGIVAALVIILGVYPQLLFNWFYF